MKREKIGSKQLLKLYKIYLNQANQKNLNINSYHVNEHDNSGDTHPNYHNNSHDNTPGANSLKKKYVTN